ncbi:hypothetical protein B0O80DRAFT_271566 [Mortierella sp. GBAus27b]|nr:hypothetical protein B0O80DRAFT_271566 [Mortierella sp. GBAus27b]
MSKLFSSSPYAQATYSPLRAVQGQDDDPDTTGSNHAETTGGHRRTLSSARQNYQSPPQNSGQRQFRHRSFSQSSNRTVHSMTDQHQSSQVQLVELGAFAEGVDHSEESISITQQSTNIRISSGAACTSPTNDRPLRRGSTIRTQSLIEETSSWQEASFADKPTSLLPPKYSVEDLQYSEPARLSVDEETGLGLEGNEDGQGDGLLMQALTTLVFAVTGLICAGWLLDIIQHWQVFIDISELIILIPILLNLKGNLEMNLASRLSTASNMGLLDQRTSRNAFIKGNLGLLQLQSLTVGSVAGLFSFGLGAIVHPTTNNAGEIALIMTASMLCAAMSSFVLGGFMCGLVLVCRKYKINPDNIACPLASSFGDLVTLVILAGCSVVLKKFISTPLPVILLVALLATIPGWIYYVRRNKFVAEVAKEGWVPVFAAMVISSTAGLTLERYINDYPGMALISPVLNGLTGNIGSIYASRISTALHVNVKENYRETEKALFLVHIPIQILFLAIIGPLGLGHIQWSVGVVAGYSIVALCLVVISLVMARWITHLFWKWGYDPDNYVLPILTSLIDVIGTGLLVLAFWALHYNSHN